MNDNGSHPVGTGTKASQGMNARKRSKCPKKIEMPKKDRNAQKGSKCPKKIGMPKKDPNAQIR